MYDNTTILKSCFFDQKYIIHVVHVFMFVCKTIHKNILPLLWKSYYKYLANIQVVFYMV